MIAILFRVKIESGMHPFGCISLQFCSVVCIGNFMKTVQMLGLVVLAVFANLAQASAIDVTAVTTDIAAQAVPIGLVGTAVMLIFLAVKAFKWVRRAMS